MRLYKHSVVVGVRVQPELLIKRSAFDRLLFVLYWSRGGRSSCKIDNPHGQFTFVRCPGHPEPMPGQPFLINLSPQSSTVPSSSSHAWASISSISICCLTQSGISDASPLPHTSPSKGAPISRTSKSTVSVAMACCRRAL